MKIIILNVAYEEMGRKSHLIPKPYSRWKTLSALWLMSVLLIFVAEVGHKGSVRTDLRQRL